MKEGTLPAHPDPNKKDTRSIKGQLVSDNPGQLHIKLNSGITFKVPKSEVERYNAKDGFIVAIINEAWLSQNCIGD